MLQYKNSINKNSINRYVLAFCWFCLDWRHVYVCLKQLLVLNFSVNIVYLGKTSWHGFFYVSWWTGSPSCEPRNDVLFHGWWSFTLTHGPTPLLRWQQYDHFEWLQLTENLPPEPNSAKAADVKGTKEPVLNRGLASEDCES